MFDIAHAVAKNGIFLQQGQLFGSLNVSPSFSQFETLALYVDSVSNILRHTRSLGEPFIQQALTTLEQYVSGEEMNDETVTFGWDTRHSQSAFKSTYNLFLSVKFELSD